MDVSQYLEIFIDESSEHLQSLSDCIMTLEKEPDNKDTINEVFRAAHSLKGMAGTMGFKRMQHLTHDMENVFQEVRSDKISVDSSMIDLLFKCLDALDQYLENVKATSDEGTEDSEMIIKELNDFIAKANNATAAPAPVAPAPVPVQVAAPVQTPAADVVESANPVKIQLTDAENEEIANAKAEGKHVYAITVYVNNECLLKAARAFLVFRAVEAYGHVFANQPSSQDIEDEKFDLDFSFCVASDESLDKIIAAAKDVSEIDDVVGEEVVDVEEEEVPVVVPVQVVPAQAAASVQTAAPVKAAPVQPAPVPAATPQPATAAAPQAQKKQTPAKSATNRTIRVDIEKLDNLMNQVSELLIAKNSLVSVSSSEAGIGGNQVFRENVESLERITTNLHESVMKVRMVPIESVVNKFPRMIRDLARSLNKKMELYMTGEDTELDRTVVDQIGDPLQHLLRNSADHGLERAEVRKERGKPETGTIFLNAYQEGNNVIIQVGDDGNGIDVEAVKTKAIERGVITAEQAAVMTQKEAVNLLFMPSFSMAKEITDISGRGVGLDVVKSNIEALGGDVEVKTKLGEGSTFTVRLPLTLAIIQALLVKVREELYAIALGSITSIEDIPVKDIKYVEAKEVIHLRDTVIPLVRLDRVLDVEPVDDPESLTVVIVKKGDQQAGLVVDDLIGQQEIVIKSLGKYMTGNKLISGATILGDGEVALIIDANTLM